MGKNSKRNKQAVTVAANAAAIAEGQTEVHEVREQERYEVARLVGSKDAPVGYTSLWAFINSHGGPASVEVVPLENVKREPGVNPVPFGYNGKVGGVRATIQGWLLNGVDGNRTYQAIMAKAKPLGHSSLKPVCLFAMLNGGYSPSSATFGTPYCALVAYGMRDKEQGEPATEQPAAA